MYLYTIYVSERLGLEGGDDAHQTEQHKYLSVIGSKMTFKQVPMMRMRNNDTTNTSLYRQHQFCFSL